MVTPEPSWHQFAREIPWGPEPAAILGALSLEPPPGHRPTRFAAPGLSVLRQRSQHRQGEHEFILWWGNLGGQPPEQGRKIENPGTSLACGSPEEILSHVGHLFPSYGATGKALRHWLSWWGWEPPAKGSAAAPPPPPPMVI